MNGQPSSWCHTGEIGIIVRKLARSKKDHKITFRKIGSGADCVAYQVLCDGQIIENFVVKIYRHEVNNKTHIPRKNNPLAKQYFLFPKWYHQYFVIQDKVDRTNRGKAFKLIQQCRHYKKGTWCDGHHLNVGWLNGQPCIIDWNH